MSNAGPPPGDGVLSLSVPCRGRSSSDGALPKRLLPQDGAVRRLVYGGRQPPACLPRTTPPYRDVALRTDMNNTRLHARTPQVTRSGSLYGMNDRVALISLSG